MNKKGEGEGKVLALFLLVIMATVVIIVYFNPSMFSRDDTDSVNMTTNNKEWFNNQYDDILSADRQLENSFDRLENFRTMYSDKIHYERYNKIFQSQVIEYESLVDEYNERSSKENSNLFKGRLPYKIEKEWTSE